MAIDRVYMDTNCFIEAIKTPSEDSKSPHANDLWYVRRLMDAARAGEIEIVTSYVTLVETRGVPGSVAPTDELKRVVRSVLESGQIVRLSQLTRGMAELARELHWSYGINLGNMDAIHVATAKITGCRELVTLDFSSSRSPIKNAAKIKNAIGLSVTVPSKSICLPFEYLQQPLTEAAPEIPKK